MKWPWSVTAKGFAMGVADLVPGVSGGTVAFIAGIYDPLLDSLSAISGPGFQALKKGQLIEAWNAINGMFLLALGLGIVLAIATLASPLHWLLANEPVLLRAFFMGLVAMSVPLVGKHVGRWGADAWVWAAVGCAIAGFVTSLPPLVQSSHPLLLMASGALGPRATSILSPTQGGCGTRCADFWSVGPRCCVRHAQRARLGCGGPGVEHDTHR